MQVGPKGATITGAEPTSAGGSELFSIRLCVNLTWASVDVKSWHSRSAHRAENTSMAPARPHRLQMMWGKWVKSPVPVVGHSAPVSATGLSFTPRRRCWMASSLVPDKPEPPGEGAELRLQNCARGEVEWERQPRRKHLGHGENGPS